MQTLAKYALILTVPLVITFTEQADAGDRAVSTAGHPAAGSWFGKAVQLTDGVTPGIALYMTPTLTKDGMFLGSDSLSLGGPPFGPHTIAHGRWAGTDHNSIVADYLFMLPDPTNGSTTPPTSSIIGARFVWQADVIGRNTMVGHVNITIGTPIPEDWEPLDPLDPDDHVTVPPEAEDLVNAPEEFYTNPADAAPSGVLVFRFRIHRVQQFTSPRKNQN